MQFFFSPQLIRKTFSCLSWHWSHFSELVQSELMLRDFLLEERSLCVLWCWRSLQHPNNLCARLEPSVYPSSAPCLHPFLLLTHSRCEGKFMYLCLNCARGQVMCMCVCFPCVFVCFQERQICGSPQTIGRWPRGMMAHYGPSENAAGNIKSW